MVNSTKRGYNEHCYYRTGGIGSVLILKQHPNTSCKVMPTTTQKKVPHAHLKAQKAEPGRVLTQSLLIPNYFKCCKLKMS